jgi:hypothetical protein
MSVEKTVKTTNYQTSVNGTRNEGVEMWVFIICKGLAKDFKFKRLVE